MGIEAIELLLGADDRWEVGNMDTMDSIASMATGMSAARLAVEASVNIEKKAMDMEELAGQEMMAMLPPPPPLGQYIDTYA